MFLAEYPVQNQNDANHVIGPYGVSISGDSKFLGRRMIAIYAMSLPNMFVSYAAQNYSDANHLFGRYTLLGVSCSCYVQNTFETSHRP